MIIDLSDCKEYKENFSATYPGESMECPHQFQVEQRGIRFWTKKFGDYTLRLPPESAEWREEVALLKKLFPEAFL